MPHTGGFGVYVFYVSAAQLLQGFAKSCGCLKNRIIYENMKFVDGTSVAMLEARKKKIIRTNTSGYNGVYQNKKNGKWVAQITFKGKTYYLGNYDDIEEAVQARRKGEKMYDDFLNWYYIKKAKIDLIRVQKHRISVRKGRLTCNHLFLKNSC